MKVYFDNPPQHWSKIMHREELGNMFPIDVSKEQAQQIIDRHRGGAVPVSSLVPVHSTSFRSERIAMFVLHS